MKAVFLINLGTPDSYKPKDVYRYLIEFLTDKRVITYSWIKRQLLVRGLIVLLRYKQSAKSYKEIWTKEGSPLLVHGKAIQKLLQQALGESFYVELGMRYGKPSIEQGLKNILKKNVEEIIILPLFPQYASATTGSVHEKIMELLKTEEKIPNLKFISSFADHPLFIEALCNKAKNYAFENYDHFIFSFHGLPKSHLMKADQASYCQKSLDCCQNHCSKNRYCYAAECHKTASSIISKLQLPKEKCTLTYQSRLGKEPWIEPFTLDTIHKLAHKQIKNILVFSPSFICDCLETTFEIKTEYYEEFKKWGGEKLDLVEGLNQDPTWIRTLENLVLKH